VLPHQVPATFRRAVKAPLGLLLFAAAAIWVWTLKPVLGMAMIIFLAAVVIYQSQHTMLTEGMTTPALIQDKVSNKKPQRWFQEVVMQEKPKGIQERTGNGRIIVDTVTEHDATPWHDEPEGAPMSIQERTVPEHSLAEHDEDLGSHE
jgi:hypothetical protein